MSDQNTLIDKTLVRRSFDRAASTYDEAAVLQREVGERVIERLDFLKIQPQVILDLGSGTGYCTQSLASRYPEAKIISMDFSMQMLSTARSQFDIKNNQFVCADMETLPFADKSVDFIFSNLTLQWCNDLPALFNEFKRILKTDGLLMFSTFGPDTLWELRESWQSVDDYVHVNNFVDMHNVGDALFQAGMGDVVMDSEPFTLTYKQVKTLMKDLKDIGAHNVNAGRPHGMTGKAHLQKMMTAYEKFRTEGVLPATYEVIYGHAWALEYVKIKDPQSVSIPVHGIGFSDSGDS